MDTKKFNKLLRKIKTDEKAYNELYRYYFPKIPHHIYNKFKNIDLGEDIAQICFTKILTLKIEEYIDKPTNWIYTICDNAFIDELKKKHLDILIPSDEAQNLSPNSFDIMVYGEYWEKLQKLDEITRKIIIMNIWEGYNFLEILDILKINYDNVRQKQSRGIKLLRKLSK